MIQLQDVSLFIDSGGDVRPLLGDISCQISPGHFTAVVGPSGCGKSTLLKLIAGVAQGNEEGSITWKGRDLQEKDFLPYEIGYVPQFSIAHDELTARESVETALRLRVGGKRGSEVRQAAEEILERVGLTEPADRYVKVLSGGQKRRLALAMELVSAPEILLCDEVTSGLDPHAEDEIVALLASIAHDWNRMVVSVTHSLRHLDRYDSVIVLYRGVLAYHGRPSHLAHYFRVDDAHELFGQLETREAHEWAQSWKKHRASYEVPAPDPEEKAGEKEDGEKESPEKAQISDEVEPPPVAWDPLVKLEEGEVRDGEVIEVESVKTPEADALPGLMAQFLVLLQRRFRIFFRARGQLLLQLGLIFGFPLLVAFFAWNGLPQVQNLSMGLGQDIMQQMVEAKDFLEQATKIGSLVSGIIMFQVILLTLMGANNSGREIAAERQIFEKEKLAGVRSGAYVASKAVFLSGLVIAQSVWMGFFVHYVCGFPGNFGSQLLFLIMVNAAMTAVCLAISSWMATAEQASLVSIYLVGFQLPLSGAVLALPKWLGEATCPFIAAYWSWSGMLQTLRSERYYEIVSMVAQTSLSTEALCLYVLFFHIVIGLFVAWLGCQRARWE